MIVHATDWTPQMREQFPQFAERLAACGYGVPDEEMAIACARDRATVVVEDEMPNGFERDKGQKPGREIKLFRLPAPEHWVDLADTEAELRGTLSYFAEPNLARRRVHPGLRWDESGGRRLADRHLAASEYRKLHLEGWGTSFSNAWSMKGRGTRIGRPATRP